MAFWAAINAEDLAQRMGTPDIDVIQIITRLQEPSPMNPSLEFVISYDASKAANHVAWNLASSIRVAYLNQTYSAKLSVLETGGKTYVAYGGDPHTEPSTDPTKLFEIITGSKAADGRSFSPPWVYVQVRNLKPRTETYDLELILQAYAVRLEAHAKQLQQKHDEHFASVHA